MTKGQLSFDFILVIAIFVIILNVVISFVNDFEVNNKQVVDDIKNYNDYLFVSDYVLSAANYDYFTIDKKIISLNNSCRINVTGNTINFGNLDLSVVWRGSRNLSVSCDGIYISGVASP